MILETVLAMCLLASGLGFGPSWDAVAWMQLSRTELVVEFERLSDQAVRRLRKAITSSVHVASAHMEIGVHLFAALLSPRVCELSSCLPCAGCQSCNCGTKRL